MGALKGAVDGGLDIPHSEQRKTKKPIRNSFPGTSSSASPLTVSRACTKRLMLPSAPTPHPRLRLRRRSPRRGGPLPRLVLRPERLRLQLPRKLSSLRLRIRKNNFLLASLERHTCMLCQLYSSLE